MAFNKLTDAQDERLAMLAEEVAEVIQCCTKIQRHGYENYNPIDGTHLNNRQHLQKELADLCAVMDQMCAERDLSGSNIESLSKKAWAQKLKYAHHQEDLVNVEAGRRSALWRKGIDEWTGDELQAEYSYFIDKLAHATEWGAAVGEYQKNVKLIKHELDRRLIMSGMPAR